MTGGEESPCVGPHEWGPHGFYQVNFGRPCPRVELDPENREAWRLVWLGMHEPTRPLMASLAERMLAKFPDLIATAIISRAGGTLLSSAAIGFMYPKAAAASGTRTDSGGRKMKPVPPPDQSRIETKRARR